jgi:hypothetical protein
MECTEKAPHSVLSFDLLLYQVFMNGESNDRNDKPAFNATKAELSSNEVSKSN